jgi:hypothetical protein
MTTTRTPAARIPRATLEALIAKHRPDLALHAEPDRVNYRGFYKRAAGPASSYRGFRTWREVALALDRIPADYHMGE